MEDSSYLLDAREHLVPYQKDFVEKFLGAERGSRMVLRAQVGTGKTHATSVAIGLHLLENPQARILVICPIKVLCEHWRERLSSLTEKEADLMDGPRYRYLQTEMEIGANPWETSGLWVTSTDFVKREEKIGQALDAAWDWVVFDEAHMYSGRTSLRSKLFVNFWKTENADRILSISAFGQSAIFWEDQEQLSIWDGPDPGELRRDILVEWNPERPKPDVSWAMFERAAEEREVRKIMSGLFPEGDFRHRILKARANSSLFALQESLQNIRRRISSSTDRPFDPDVPEREGEGGEVPSPEENVQGPDYSGVDEEVVLNLLDRIDSIPREGKLDIFLDTVHGLPNGSGHSSIVYSEYRDTLEYLASSLVSAGIEGIPIMSELQTEEKLSRVDMIKRNGGVLLATSASVMGMGLAFFDTIVNFDVPNRPEKIWERISPIWRISRGRRKLSIITFACSAPDDETSEKNLRRLFEDANL